VADITVQVSSPGLSVWGSDTWGSLSWSNQSATSTSVGQVSAFNIEGWGRYSWGILGYGAPYENSTIEQSGFSLSSNIGSVCITRSRINFSFRFSNNSSRSKRTTFRNRFLYFCWSSNTTFRCRSNYYRNFSNNYSRFCIN